MQKSKKILFVLMLLFVIIGSLFAQDKAVQSIDFGAGYSHTRMLDQLVTPLVYASNGIPLHIGYKWEKERFIFNISFNLSASFLNNTGDMKWRTVYIERPNNEGNPEIEEIDVPRGALFGERLDISYLHKLGKKNSDFSFYAGGIFTQYLYYGLTAVPRMVHSEISINPAFSVNWQIKKNIKIKGTLSFPVCGLVTRLPHSANSSDTDGEHSRVYVIFDQGSDFVTLNTYQRINLNFGVEKKLNEKWSVSARYLFHFFRYTEKYGINNYSNTLMLTLTKKLN